MKLACFLKVKQKLTGIGCQNHAIVQYKVLRAFCEKRKIAGKKFLELKGKIFRFPVF